MMHDLVQALLPIVPWMAGALFLFLLFALVYLFRAFKNEPEKTRVAVMLELSLLRKFGQLFTRKTDQPTNARRSFGETISEPIEPPVRKSVAKVEDEEGG